MLNGEGAADLIGENVGSIRAVAIESASSEHFVTNLFHSQQSQQQTIKLLQTLNSVTFLPTAETTPLQSRKQRQTRQTNELLTCSRSQELAVV